VASLVKIKRCGRVFEIQGKRERAYLIRMWEVWQAPRPLKGFRRGLDDACGLSLLNEKVIADR